jgi:DNA recombination protein RmuC
LRASQTSARKKFKTHLTKHINDVSTKYVIPPQTSSAGAILFLPSEAVFSEVISHHPDLMKLAHTLNVWICSPTTLMAVLTTMRGVTRDISLQQKSKLLLSELNLILRDVDNVVKRAGVVEKHFEKSKESLRLLEVSAEKGEAGEDDGKGLEINTNASAPSPSQSEGEALQ